MMRGGSLPEWQPEPLAHALEMIAAALQSGLTPVDALSIAVECTEYGRDESERLTAVIRATSAGSVDGRCWQRESDGANARDAYRSVAAVWTLALETGAPLAEAISTLSDQFREVARVRGRLEAAAAAPRTSQRLLSFLPLGGPVLALLIGADPVELYLTSTVALVSVGFGLSLTLVGWRWSSAMVRDALLPRRYADVAGRT